MHVAGAGAGLGHHRAVPAGQLPVPGLGCHGGQPGRAVRRDPGRHQAAAQPRRGGRGQPPQPDQLAAEVVQAGAHPGSGLHLEPHQLLLHPRLPAEHPHQIRAGQHSGAGGRVQEHELLLHPERDRAGRAHRPRRAAGHRRGPSCTARSGHYHDHLGWRAGFLFRERAQRWPLAQRAGQAGDCAGCGDQRPQQCGQRDGGCRLHGHRLGAGQRDDLPGCLPGCVQRLPGRDRQGLGHCLVLPVVEDTPKPEGQRRLTSGMAPRRSRQAQGPFIASPWPGATRAR